MTERKIQKLFVDDPQKLVDDETRFRLVPDFGEVKLVDGVAAGGPWLAFQFLDGPYAGKTIYCAADNIYEHEQRARFDYQVHSCDDGMLFNKDPDRFNPEQDEDWGGDYLPELDGTLFKVKRRQPSS